MTKPQPKRRPFMGLWPVGAHKGQGDEPRRPQAAMGGAPGQGYGGASVNAAARPPDAECWADTSPAINCHADDASLWRTRS